MALERGSEAVISGDVRNGVSTFLGFLLYLKIPLGFSARIWYNKISSIL